MAIGNLGAAPGAQPAAGPTGAPIWLDTGPAAGSAPVGQAGNPAPYGSVTYFNSSFESVMAAVSRGEVSLNQVIGVGGSFGGNNAAREPDAHAGDLAGAATERYERAERQRSRRRYREFELRQRELGARHVRRIGADERRQPEAADERPRRNRRAHFSRTIRRELR